MSDVQQSHAQRPHLVHMFLKEGSGEETCFAILLSELMKPESAERLCKILRGSDVSKDFGPVSFLEGFEVVEIGPMLNFQTTWSETLVGICRASGLSEVLRVEKSRRQVLPVGVTLEAFFKEHGDRMTEQLYREPLASFDSGMLPQPVRIIPLIEKGIDALIAINTEMGLGMDEWDLAYYMTLFVKNFGRNPTDVELAHLAQANSEHCRHRFFAGKMIFNGKEVIGTLFDIVKEPYRTNPGNSIIAFHDNASAIQGFLVAMLLPENPGKPSRFSVRKPNMYHPVFTAETHNHPSAVAPYPGAQTGTGGRIRDVQAVGRGGLTIAGTAGYGVGQLNIPGYSLPWEDASLKYPSRLALPLDILIRASDGASDYGNHFGEPVIAGFTRSFGFVMPDGSRREWIKPIMFTGGLGQMNAGHVHKESPQQGDMVVMIGGPAYRIGVGGGAASSMASGSNTEDLDFASVQRGNPEMANRVNRVVRACIEMGDNNPIESIHDQGAGGPANVLTELVSPAGAKIHIRGINVGDLTLSTLEKWIAECQERLAMLIKRRNIDVFREICARENVPCEILGEVTGDERIVVVDDQDGSTPVDLDLDPILGDLPQKEFHFDRLPMLTKPFALPSEFTLEGAVRRVLQLLDVGSKLFLTNKADRGVTGLVIQQQCCGPVQLPVADCGVVAQGYFSDTGAVTAIGERPMIMLNDSAAGARMGVAEMLFNMAGVYIGGIENIKCSANEMWPVKMEGEGPRMWDALVAMSDLMIKLGIAVDGGKDSLSMVARVGDETVKAPGQLVISGYAAVPDVSKVVTPDFKHPGKSRVWFIDPSLGKCRLGGSALARVYGQLGDEAPDVDDPEFVGQVFEAMQELVKKGIVSAYHDRSDGGLITTLFEMAFAGNCGLRVDIGRDEKHSFVENMFNEELGLALEVLPENEDALSEVLVRHGIGHCSRCIGATTKVKNISIHFNGALHLCGSMLEFRDWWEETSYRIELETARKKGLDEGCIHEEKENIFDQNDPEYKLTFEPKKTPLVVMQSSDKPKAAIVRAEGTNGDRELAAAFYAAGFDVYDITMSDLLEGRATLDDFRMVAFAGGFSYGDVTGSAHGWASVVRYNEKLSAMFERFRTRPDTLSFGVCNGCQFLVDLGWVCDDTLHPDQRPRLTHNVSERFESRFPTVEILASPAIMLWGMEGSKIGVWSAHGEGRFVFPSMTGFNIAMAFVDDEGLSMTERYPFNPNGSPNGITALCSPDGRHFVMMPHPERAFQMRQWQYVPQELQELDVSPWLHMFQNARKWLCENKTDK